MGIAALTAASPARERLWQAGGVGEGFRFEDVSLVADDGTVVLERVSTTVPGRGITVLSGPSGAGKSTILRLCNRLEVPSAGRITLDGADLADLDPLALRRRVGMVFQRPVVFAGTVRDNLLVAAPGAAEAELVGVLERVGLDPGLLDRRADDLSGGEAQRLCIARTLLTGPEVLLMDEPTSSLDVANRDRVEALARALAAGGLAVVWVSHDPEQVARLADHVCRVAPGGIVADAGPDPSPPGPAGERGR